MKNKLLFLIFFILSPFVTHAQVGIGVEDPHPSAALEIVSKEKGLLISRMTLSEKNAIQNPAESLLIYQTDGDIGFYYFDGSFWVYLKNIKQINADWNATSGNAQILNKPAIAKAGTSGDFNDLLNIPALVLAGDTSKMLLPYLTLDKIQPFLDGKASVADLNKEMARAIQLEQQLAANLQAEISRATKADSVSKINMETVEQKFDAQVKVNSDKINANTADINSLNTKVTANTSGIQTNATTIGQKESSANKSTDVTLADGTDTKFPTEKAVKTFVDGKVATLNTASTNMQAELDATELGSGLATDGSYVANTASNYIKTATSLKDATEKLDAQAKINAQNISINTTDISTMDTKVTANTSGIQTNATTIGLKESSANKSTDVTLADGTDTKFPTEKAVKTYVDQAISNRGVGVPYTGATQTLNLGNNELKTTSNITASGFLVPNATNSQFLKGDGTLDSKQYVEVKTNTVAIGTDAGKLGQQQNAIAIGAEAGSEIQNQNSIAIGAGAGRGLQEVGSIAIGYVAGDGGQGSHSIALGSNVAQGAQAAESVGIGYAAAQYNQGEKSVALGAFAGNNNQSNNAVAIGYNAQTAAPNSVALGSGAVVTASNTIQLGNSSVTAVKTAGKLTTGAITLPNLDGTSGQVLATNGAGLVSWITPSTATNGTFVDLNSAQFISGAKTFRRRILLENESWGTKATMTMGFPRSGNNLSSLAIGINTLDKHQYGTNVIAIGNEALFNDLRGSYNIGIGYRALYNLKDVNNDWGNNNVAIGRNAGLTLIEGDNNTLLGSETNTSTSTISNATALGNQAVVTASNTIQLGNSAVTAVKTSGKLTTGAITLPNLDGTSGQVLATNGSGVVSWISPSNATNATFVDLTSNQSISGSKTFSDNIGLLSGPSEIVILGTKSYVDNIFFGQANFDYASSIGRHNTVMGAFTFTSSSGSNNTIIGSNAMRQGAGSSGDDNTALGFRALTNAQDGFFNTAVGVSTMESGVGSYNTALGNRAGIGLTTGIQNTLLGSNSNVSTGDLVNATAIGNGALVSSSNTMQLGNSAVTAVKTSGKITTGAITLPNLDGTSGQVLSTDGAGLVTWVTPSSASSSNFVDLISNQTVAGNKIFDNVKIVSNQSYPRTIFQVGGDGNYDYPLKYTQLNTDVTRLSFGFRGKEFRMKVNQNSGILDKLTYSYFDGTTDKVAFQINRNSSLTIGGVTYPSAHNAIAGQVLTTNASGVASWVTPSTATNATFMDLTSAQTVGGDKTFNSNILVNGMTVGTTSVDANTNSSSYYATVLGINATAGSYATSIGNNATAGSSYGVAIGRNASAGTSYSIAIGGLDATASQSYSVAIGGNAPSATGVYSTAIGGSVPTASANFATALGSSTTASGLNSTALGYGASVSSPNTIQLGNTSVTNVNTSGKITTGAITLPNTDGVNGQVLTTNGAGVAAWSTPTFSTNATILNTVTIEWSALNNYDVSNVTVIFVRPNSSWTNIYGLQGGVLGQMIHIYTVNNQMSNQNDYCCTGLSLWNFDSANNDGIQKFVASGGINIDSNRNTTLIFDGTYWRVTSTRGM